MHTQLYKAGTRGSTHIGWLDSHFSFSFANYYDASRMGFGKLRVLNDDVIEAGNGFGMHPHENMEIVTIVTEGTLEHKDSAGNGGVLQPGDVQVMSAGSGIAHSEFNASTEESLKLFQLWIETKELNIEPFYDQRTFSYPENTLVTVASGLSDAKALYIHQNARILVGTVTENHEVSHTIAPGNGLFIFCIEGEFLFNDIRIERRDALEITDVETITLSSETGGRCLLIEVPL